MYLIEIRHYRLTSLARTHFGSGLTVGPKTVNKDFLIEFLSYFNIFMSVLR